VQNKNRTDKNDDVVPSATEVLPSTLSAAILLLERGKYQDACRLLELSLEKSSETIVLPLYWCLGWAYALNKEWDNAIHLFDRAARLSPEQPESFLYLGEMYRCNGDLRGACEMWWQALTLAWQQETSLIVQLAAAFLASAQVTYNDTQEEIIRQHLVLVIKSPGWTDNTIDPSQIPFMLSLVGNLLLRARQYYTAAWLLRGKTEDKGGFAVDAYHLGQAEEHLGKKAEAAKSYALALRKEPSYQQARRALCALHFRSLNLLSAIYHFGILHLGRYRHASL
jgi:tetratricopeptide (TPR) repeat protein